MYLSYYTLTMKKIRNASDFGDFEISGCRDVGILRHISDYIKTIKVPNSRNPEVQKR